MVPVSMICPAKVSRSTMAAHSRGSVKVAYQMADVPARDYVEPFPISPLHKDLYAELFDYFKAETYLGDLQPITAALPGFRISGVEDFIRDELFAGD